MALILRGLDRALDLALPATCAGCGSEGAAICESCLPSIHARRSVPPGTPLGLGEGPPEPLLQLEWCAPFAGTMRHALHALKYAGERRLAVPIGGAMATRWAQAGRGGELIVPIPVHEQRRRQRGYDQAELLAAAAATSLRLPWVPALVRVRATDPQFRLDRRHRAANVSGAFGVRPEAVRAVRGRWVVLVDDVVTTGATLRAAASVLLDAGAIGVSALTAARER